LETGSGHKRPVLVSLSFGSRLCSIWRCAMLLWDGNGGRNYRGGEQKVQWVAELLSIGGHSLSAGLESVSTHFAPPQSYARSWKRIEISTFCNCYLGDIHVEARSFPVRKSLF
jgi:hypothetical protein